MLAPGRALFYKDEGGKLKFGFFLIRSYILYLACVGMVRNVTMCCLTVHYTWKTRKYITWVTRQSLDSEHTYGEGDGDTQGFLGILTTKTYE